MITIRNKWLLRHLGYVSKTPGCNMVVSHHWTMWLRVIWWRMSGQVSRGQQ